MTDNVVDLMISRIQGLSDNAANLLSLAACIGNRFDLNLLSKVYKKTVSETSDDLFEAVQEEIVLPEDESYKYVSERLEPLSSDKEPVPSIQAPKYTFLYDRVQQATYSFPKGRV